MEGERTGDLGESSVVLDGSAQESRALLGGLALGKGLAKGIAALREEGQWEGV
jgi:hypothetical protein